MSTQRAGTIVALLAAAVFAVILVRPNPPSTSSGGTKSLWSQAVQAELAANPTTHPVGYLLTAKYSDLPDVGHIKGVVVYRGPDGYMVWFQGQSRGLVYLHDWARPPLDTCDQYVGGNWYRSTALERSNLCPPGFTYTPGP